MKFSATFVLIALYTGIAQGAVADVQQTPVNRVVTLLHSLKADIETDGKKEQKLYDKYACWVEDATKRKTDTIATSEADIASATELITKLAAEIATHTSSIKSLEDDIADNKAAQKDAFEKREAEHEAFMAENKDEIASKGALEEAIKVLTDTGTGALIEKGKFLGVIQQAQVLSVVGGLGKVLKNSAATESVSQDDLDVVRDFVARPSDFFSANRAAKAGMSAAQVSLAPNPFGDYAPQSTRIQGILKGMLQAFTASIGKAMEEEAAAEKAYKELAATRMMELKTLEKTKVIEESSMAAKKASKADTEEIKEKTEDELAAAEAFLEETVKAGKQQASEFAERSRLRSEEIFGIQEAVQILTSPSASKIFLNATTTFLQVSSVSSSRAQEKREKAYKQLKKLASRFHSIQLGKMAAALKLGGHFDQVIAMIEKMMELLRKEEAADIFHRDRCQSALNANKNEIEDLNKDIADNKAEMTAMATEISELNDKIKLANDAIANTTSDMDHALYLRNEEHAQFVMALKDDTDAIALIEKAIISLSKYYVNNKLVIGGFLQTGGRSDPVYSTSIDDAPTPTFAKSEKYASESGGIVSILSMIKEDLEKEVKVAREEEAAAEAEFDAADSKMKAQIATLKALIGSLEEEEAGVQSDSADAMEHETAKTADLGSQGSLKVAIYSDCSWVQTHFKTRAEKRKTEMAGLTDAKAYLSGIMGN